MTSEFSRMNSPSAFPDIPGYTIKKTLGQGGMARVYIATQDSFGRDVALKVMSTHLASSDAMWGKRFLHEAQVVAQLSHPNIVPVFDVGHHDGYYYMSMELLKGGDLKARLAKGVSIPETVRIIRQIANGLDFAGEKGFVHRDIKPENIMFREDGSPVILDFGIAKQKNTNNRMTQTGTIVGTTAYMSPEQAQGFELDERSDVYSLGIMFYEMLTGRTPFLGESSVAVLLKHVSEPAPPLPDHLDIFQPVMDLSLAKKPEDRYNRARDMIRDLEALKDDVELLFADAPPVVVNAGSEDQTVAADAVTQQATRVTAVRGTSIKRTSAKATIHARKQAEQAKQRRKNFLGIAVATIALGAPLSYLAYRQFVVAPQQEAQLKAEAESAKQATQQKIASLLADAAQQQKANVASDAKAGKQVAQLLQQVLVLEENNAQAKQLQKTLASQHLDKARELLAASQPLAAGEQLSLVESVEPSHPDLGALNAQLEQARNSTLTQQAEAMFVSKKVTELLTEADQHIAKGRLFAPAGNCAWDSYQSALEFDAQNADARAGMETLLDGLYSKAEQEVRGNQLAAAKQDLQLLQQRDNDKARLKPLLDAIAAAEQKVAASAAAEIRTEAAPAASAEQDDTLLERALAARDQRAAEKHLAALERNAPRHPRLAALRERVAQSGRVQEQNGDLLVTADKLIASSSGSPEQARKKLNEAWDNIQNAKRLDPDGDWAGSKARLQDRYAALVSGYVASDNKDAAQLLLADARNNGLMNGALDAAQSQLGAPVEANAAPKKKKTIAVGGF